MSDKRDEGRALPHVVRCPESHPDGARCYHPQGIHPQSLDGQHRLVHRGWSDEETLVEWRTP